MPGSPEVDLRALMGPVARELLGEPNKALSTATVLRYGTNGSLAVDLEKGLFFNHEHKEGGGTLALIEFKALVDHDGAWEWLRTHNYAPEPAKPNGHADGFLATWDYLDTDRTLLMQVCRKAGPKKFLQRRPDGYDWAWSVKGVKPVPYRLPELLAAIAAGREVWVVEGEKDVDRLRAEGLEASCNAGGSGKWRAALNEYFRGADVIVVGDNDEVGREHANFVAGQLTPVAKRVRLIKDLSQTWPSCPPKGDCSDFLDAGHPVAALQEIAARARSYGDGSVLPIAVFTTDKLEGLPMPSRNWHVRDMVPARTVTLLGGDGGVGKSILALQLAVATAGELPWLGQQVHAGNVLYLSAEDDRDELHRRLDAIAIFYGVALGRLGRLMMWPLVDEDALLVTGPPGQALQATPRWDELRRAVSYHRPDLIVLDSLADVYGSNENDRSQVRQFVHLLRGLEATVVLLAHPSLTGLSSGSGLSGSTAWSNSVRSRLYLSMPEVEDGGASEPNLRTLAVRKANYTQAGAELRIRYVAGAFENDDVGIMPGLDRQIAADRVDAQFLDLLDAFTTEGRDVSHHTGHAYAPALFAADPRARGTTAKGFAAAMGRQFAAGRIRVGLRGPPSRRISFIRRT